MKLATLTSADKKNRNGDLIVVSKDNKSAVKANLPVGPSLLDALQSWSGVHQKLETLYANLNAGSVPESFALDLSACLAPLPNAPGLFDGSAFLSHVHRARKSRGDTMPESARVTPLMYQGVSDNLLASRAPLELMNEDFGGDFEGEYAVITTDVPRGTAKEDLEPYMVLFTLFNDVTYREVLKTEIQTKFGFLQSKPNSSFAPIVVTPDEFGPHWREGRINLELEVKLNGELFGNPEGKEMNFSFQQLVAHACRTRPLSAGTIVGSGTVSNESRDRGFACLTEKRYQEVIDGGKASTPWLRPNDHLYMNVQHDGVSVFGEIDQVVRI